MRSVSYRMELWLSSGRFLQDWRITVLQSCRMLQMQSRQSWIERGITKDNVDGVGIGIPGPVNENGEVPMCS